MFDAGLKQSWWIVDLHILSLLIYLFSVIKRCSFFDDNSRIQCDFMTWISNINLKCYRVINLAYVRLGVSRGWIAMYSINVEKGGRVASASDLQYNRYGNQRWLFESDQEGLFSFWEYISEGFVGLNNIY